MAEAGLLDTIYDVSQVFVDIVLLNGFHYIKCCLTCLTVLVVGIAVTLCCVSLMYCNLSVNLCGRTA